MVEQKKTPTDEPTRKPVRAARSGRVTPSLGPADPTAEQFTTREIEATTLLLPICSGGLVEAVAEKYDV